MTEYGFLVASFDSRSARAEARSSSTRSTSSSAVTEIDDQAAGVKSLRDRSYVDLDRVGIYGTSYGGYASILCLLRHPDVFQAACASSPVTDFRHYDTIYTERYMRTPKRTRPATTPAAPWTHAGKLKGRLMLYYGTADNNVHPSNTLQLIQALQRAGKSFELQVGPDVGHSPISRDRMMEFFIESLVLEPSNALLPDTGTATASKGFISNPFDLQASSYSSKSAAAVRKTSDGRQSRRGTPHRLPRAP